MGNKYLDPKQNKNKQPTPVPQYHQHNEGGSQFYWPHNQALQTGDSYHRIPHSNQGESSVQQASSSHGRVLYDSRQSFEGSTASALHPYALLNTNPLSSGSNFNTALTHRPFGSSHLHTSGVFQSLGGTPSSGYASASHGTDPSLFGPFGSTHLRTSEDFRSLGGTPSNIYASASHGTNPSSFGPFGSTHLRTSGDFPNLGGTPSNGYASASHGKDPSSIGPSGSSRFHISGDFQSLGGTSSNGHASASHDTDPSSFGVWQGFSQQQSNHMPEVPTTNAVNQPPVVNEAASGANELNSAEYIMLTAKLKTCLRNYQHDAEDCLDVHIGEPPRRDPIEYNYSWAMCKNIAQICSCPKGNECPNAHGLYEFGFHPMIYRTKYCRKGRCRGCHYRQSCFYAHSEEQLRKPMEQLQIYAAQHGLETPAGSHPQLSETSETADDSPPGSTLRCALCGGGITILRWNILRQFQHDTNHAYMPCGHCCHRDCLEETMKQNVGLMLPCNRCTTVCRP